MGNLISNASDAHNPTYEYTFDSDDKLYLAERKNATYDFEELDHKTKEAAMNEVPVLIGNLIKRLEEEKKELSMRISRVRLNYGITLVPSLTKNSQPPSLL